MYRRFNLGVQFIHILILLLVLLVSYLRNFYQVQCHEVFALFSPNICIGLALKFRSFIHFELNDFK